MTPQQAAEIRTRALRQITRDCVSVHITPRQVEDLACAYLNADVRIAAQGRRLAARDATIADIRDLLPAALAAWADHHRQDARTAFVEIERLVKLPIDKKADP